MYIPWPGSVLIPKLVLALTVHTTLNMALLPWAQPVALTIGKIYSNSMMALLNDRSYIVDGRNKDNDPSVVGFSDMRTSIPWANEERRRPRDE